MVHDRGIFGGDVRWSGMLQHLQNFEHPSAEVAAPNSFLQKTFLLGLVSPKY